MRKYLYTLGIFFGLLIASISPVYALDERLEVVIAQQDGTPSFDEDDAAGHDSTEENGIVRTNDVLTYSVEVRVEGGVATNTTVSLELPQGVEAQGIPPFCGSGSTVTPETLPAPRLRLTRKSWEALPKQTILCNVGSRNPGTVQRYPLVGRVRPEVPNGTTLDPVHAAVTTDDIPEPLLTNEVSAKVSARPRFDMSNNGVSLAENNGYLGGGFLTPCPKDPAKRCFEYISSVLVSTDNDGKGIAPLTSPISITDDLSPDSLYGEPNGYPVMTDPDWLAAGTEALEKYGAQLVGCPATSVYTAPGYRINNSTKTETNSVRDSGKIACTQPGGPGTPVSISITDADTSAYTIPSTSSYPDGEALPEGFGYVISGRIDFAIPYEAVRDLGVSTTDGTADLTWDNTFTNFEGKAIDGTMNEPGANLPYNDHRSATSRIRTRGSWSKTFIGEPNNQSNTPPAEFRPGFRVWEGPTNTTTSHSGDGILLPGQKVISGINMHNQSTEDEDSSFLICDNWDNTKLQLSPGFYESSKVAALQQIPSDGAAVWFSGYKDDLGYRSDAADTPPLTVQYGSGGFGNTETCDDADSAVGWHSDPSSVPGGIAAINKVRLHTTISANTRTVGTYTTVSIALEALGADPVTGAVNEIGTILPNFAAGKTILKDIDMAAALADPAGWELGTYNPADNTGIRGDRMFMGAAVSRVVKRVRDRTSGKFLTAVANYTSGDDVRYRLEPSLTAGHPTKLKQTTKIEDCLSKNLSYVAGSATVAPTAVQLGSPPDSELLCPANQVYLRWNLGELSIGVPIEPITYSAHIARTTATGTETNTALISAAGDPSTVAARTAKASIQVVAPTGIAIEKISLTPQSDINRVGETSLDPLLWMVQFRNVKFPGPLRDVDLIDRLPHNGIDGTDFHGELTFDSAKVTGGTGILILVTKTAPADLVLDAADVSNAAGGSTVWCAGGLVVSGAGTGADCPQGNEEVTGLRFRRPGPFNPDDLFDIEVGLIPEGNLEGDVYVNKTLGRTDGLRLAVGPVGPPVVIVSAEVGDLVWKDVNSNGLQDEGEPGAEGINVSLWGTDDDGNQVGSAKNPLITVTDEDGRYTFTELPGGSYEVLFNGGDLEPGERWTTANAGELQESEELKAAALKDGAPSTQSLRADAGSASQDALDSDGDQVTGLATGLLVTTNLDDLNLDQGIIPASKPGISLKKYVNGDDADTSPGISVKVGDELTFTYVVSNIGNADLENVVLDDDVLGAITCPATSLKVGAKMECLRKATAKEGTITNVGTVTGEDTGDCPADPSQDSGCRETTKLSATDPATYHSSSTTTTTSTPDLGSPPPTLAFTGSTTLRLLLAAVALTLVGAGILAIGRRRATIE